MTWQEFDSEFRERFFEIYPPGWLSPNHRKTIGLSVQQIIDSANRIYDGMVCEQKRDAITISIHLQERVV